jgi:hypothetical protein
MLSYLHLFMDDHVGIFMSFNSQGHEGAVGHLRQAVFDQFIDRYFPGAWPMGSVPKDVAAAHARMIAGYYDDSRRPDRSFMSVTTILGAPKVTVAEDGTVLMSLMTGANHVPVHYQEIAPFVWRQINNGRRMAAKVVDGKVVRLSMDELSPFMVFDPTPAYRSPAWLVPALGIAFGAVVLTTLFWPIAAISRRRHRVQLPITGLALRGHRISRIAAAGLASITVAWLLMLTVVAGDIENLTPSLDPALLLLYALSAVVYIGGALAMLWSGWIAFTTARPVTARIWTAILVLSALILLYFAVLYHLMSFVTKY